MTRRPRPTATLDPALIGTWKPRGGSGTVRIDAGRWYHLGGHWVPFSLSNNGQTVTWGTHNRLVSQRLFGDPTSLVGGWLASYSDGGTQWTEETILRADGSYSLYATVDGTFDGSYVGTWSERPGEISFEERRGEVSTTANGGWELDLIWGVRVSGTYSLPAPDEWHLSVAGAPVTVHDRIA